ncbi:MAG: VCBS repeat-containing protein [Planctomycetes bacterium]|nr:VCBS repeat-containing protein [Planctomycetota bacterium]
MSTRRLALAMVPFLATSADAFAGAACVPAAALAAAAVVAPVAPVVAAAPMAPVVLLGDGAESTSPWGDLQRGRNFPTAKAAFGTGRSENIDQGDVDNDGDRDVVVANGSDGAAQANLIFINQGGVQGGTPGTFVDETTSRFVGVPVDTSRDIELADVDDNGDLDVFVANRGTTVNGGEVSRAYVNMGGLQFGTVGWFNESTDAFWGALVSVPPGDEEGVVDGRGPFREFSCDCDFGDLDDDGHLDLFFSSYGPNISGTRDSRIFLNDGQGTFDELWPWADPAADTKLHTIDVDLADLDGDFDLDVFASSRDSQARVYRNNRFGGTGSGEPFTDVTQTALIDTGATVEGQYNYEVELADVDGDGDFDAWMADYVKTGGLSGGEYDRILRNRGGLTFTKEATWIRGDGTDETEETDFLDFDGDGDLDAFVANFSGTNLLYQNGLANGLDADVDGLFHRTGTTTLGSTASWPELPTNADTSLDGECADMDGDGDPDILVANGANQQNRYLENVLGVPDSHAPTFGAVTVQGDKSDGTDTVLHVLLCDNAASYVIASYAVDLLYTVDGGDETLVQMARQGGQLFRGVIPAAVDGTVAWHVRATDDAGNTGVSSTFSYVQTSSVTSAWQNLGQGTQGAHGDPYLVGRGDLSAGSLTTVGLVDAAPGVFDALFLSAASTGVPFKGGVLYTIPVALTLNLATDAGGTTWFAFPWPAGLPSGVSLWWQYAVADASSPNCVTLSNALVSTTP